MGNYGIMFFNVIVGIWIKYIYIYILLLLAIVVGGPISLIQGSGNPVKIINFDIGMLGFPL